MKKNKKNILFITAFQPKINSGDSFVSHGVLNGFLKENCSVTVISFKENRMIKPDINKKSILYISKLWIYPKFSYIKKLSLFFSISPFFANKFFDVSLLEKIQKEINKKEFDQVVIHGYAMAKYSNFINFKNLIYLEDEDMNKIFKSRFIHENNFIKKSFLFTEYIKSFFYQRIYFNKFKKFWLLNKKNSNSYFSKNSKKVKIPLLAEIKKNSFSPHSKDIVFTGTLNWEENKQGLIWFLKEVWPKVARKNTTILHVIGKNIENDLKEIIDSSTNVIAHGFVNDLEKIYGKSAFAIAPIWSNAGIKIKILNYLQYGLPVVASFESTEGLISLDGITIADKKTFSRKINFLLSSKMKKAALSKKAIKNIKDNYSMENISTFLKREL